MISHADLARLAERVYLAPWSATIAADVHYALLPREDEVVVALPGTHPTEALDWLRDLSFWPVRVQGIGWVHSGFGLGAQAALARMARDLPKDGLITFTGHSLGGALAICLAALHAHQRPEVAFRVVTFGAPRVGFLLPWIGRRLRLAIERVQYARAGDLVPGVPMRPYLHGGRLTKIGVSTGDFVADHSVSRYAADVAALGV
jgi:hypothetical protein